MQHVYILTITDSANFDHVEEHSAWDSAISAQKYADRKIRELVERDSYHGLGNTFHTKIDRMEVRSA